MGMGEMVDSVQGAIEWVQGMPTIGKSIVSVVTVLVAVLVLYLLWQEPPTKTQTSTHDAITQSGNITSSAQSGGVTAGVYVNNQPPVTEQQKAQALASLQSEIEELAQFPNRPDVPEPRTLLERATIAKAPHQLFVLLVKYYKPTIVSVPKFGKELFDYKTAYYEYESKQYDLENRVTEEIGKLVAGRLRQAWMIYFQYFLFRSAGHTQQQIMDGGDFLNFGITWPEAERVYAELSKNEIITKAMAEAFSAQTNVREMAAKILEAFKHR
jgi:hypothetical protein